MYHTILYVLADCSAKVLLCSDFNNQNTDLWKRKQKKDRKSTRLNSSHANISYAVFCLKKKNPHTGCVKRRLERNTRPASATATRFLGLWLRRYRRPSRSYLGYVISSRSRDSSDIPPAG